MMSHLRWITSVMLAAGAFAAPPTPRPAPELTLTDPSGTPLSLAAYNGKVVLVQFLFTTCPHCRETSLHFATLQNELGSRGLQVIGVAFNEEAIKNPDEARIYAATNGLTFPVDVASREAVVKYLGISVMDRFVVPQVAIIDRKGVIRAQSELLGTAELMDEAKLRPVLQSLLDEKVHLSRRTAR